MSGWIKKVVERKNYKDCSVLCQTIYKRPHFLCIAKLIISYFSAVCNFRLCVNFPVGTFQVNIRVLAKFKCPAQTTRTTNKSCLNY